MQRLFQFLGFLLIVSSIFSVGETQNNVDTSREDVMDIARFAVSTIFGTSAGQKRPKVDVISASRQVVEGLLYRLELEIKLQDGSTETCNVTVLQQAWMNVREVTKKECSPSESRRGIEVPENKYHPVSTSDELVKRVAEFAVDELMRQSACFVDARLESINKAGDFYPLYDRCFLCSITFDKIHSIHMKANSIRMPYDSRPYELDITVCEWPFSGSDTKVGMPHPCSSAYPENLHECNVVVLTNNGNPRSLTKSSCTGCKYP